MSKKAIKIVLSLCEQGIFTLVSSQVLQFEIENTTDILRRERLKIIEKLATKTIKIDIEKKEEQNILKI